MSFVILDEITKTYKMGEVEIHAVDHISFSIEKGEFVVIVGPSGAGKTTVLNILGGMDTATSGKLIVDGQDITSYDSKKLTGYRRDDIGFVFQFYNLVPNLTAVENVELALQICKGPAGCGDGSGRSGTWKKAEKFSGTAFRRGTAEGVNREGTCQESQAFIMR